jgi:hypothetical protein
VDETTERLVDEGDVRLAEQAVNVLGRAKHDPIEGELEEIAGGLNARGRSPLRFHSMLRSQFVNVSHRPPGF